MDFLLCKICQICYDEEDHRPRHAPCGHELCTSCIRALIKDGIFECPKCRQKNKVDVPDSMPVNFGLIEVIRAFKTKNVSLGATGVSVSAGVSGASGATNEDMCSIHCKSIKHWCIKCQMWICIDCCESHTSIVGCLTKSSSEAMKSMKDKHTKDIDMMLTIFEEDVNYVSSKLQEHTKLAEKHAEEAKKLRKVLEQGQGYKAKLAESKDHLNTAKLPYAVSENVNAATTRKQALRSWSVMNLGTNTPLGLAKTIAEEKEVFAEMEIEFMKMYAKVTQHKESFYLHTFRKQIVSDSSICMPFERFKKIIPSCPSLVFLELSLGGVVKGNILLRLNKELPNIMANMVIIVTGQKGKSLREETSNGKRDFDIYFSYTLPFSGITVATDKSELPTAKRGDVIGNYSNYNYLQHLYWYVGTKPDASSYRGNNYRVVGHIEEGMDVLIDCHSKHSSDMPLIISDCGLVIEQQE